MRGGRQRKKLRRGLACLLHHPEVALRPCSECAKWIYDKQGRIEVRRGRQVPNTTGRTPCSTCPKENPDKAPEYELSPRNIQALHFYYTTRAMHGANLSDEMKADGTVQRNMAIIDQIVRPFEAESAISDSLEKLLPLFAQSMLGGATGGRRR